MSGVHSAQRCNVAPTTPRLPFQFTIAPVLTQATLSGNIKQTDTPSTGESMTASANPDYHVNSDDNITLMASKIIRDVLVTRSEPVRRAQLWQAVELTMGDRKPDVDGVLKRNWFNNRGTGPGRWELTDEAAAAESPFTEADGALNLARVVEYMRLCRGQAPYIGDVSDFVRICNPGAELDADRLRQGNRAIG